MCVEAQVHCGSYLLEDGERGKKRERASVGEKPTSNIKNKVTHRKQ